MTTIRLTKAQKEMLLKCTWFSDGTVMRSNQNARTAEILEDMGFVSVESVEPYTWAQSRRPRAFVIRITEAGRSRVAK